MKLIFRLLPLVVGAVGVCLPAAFASASAAAAAAAAVAPVVVCHVEAAPDSAGQGPSYPRGGGGGKAEKKQVKRARAKERHSS